MCSVSEDDGHNSKMIEWKSTMMIAPVSPADQEGV
jgi:hypothetical protein